MPCGGVTVTVFTRSPVAVDLVTAVTVNVAVPPTARFTVASMSVFVPIVGGTTEDPTDADAVHDQLAMFVFVENTSFTFAPFTAPLPVFVTRIV